MTLSAGCIIKLHKKQTRVSKPICVLNDFGANCKVFKTKVRGYYHTQSLQSGQGSDSGDREGEINGESKREIKYIRYMVTLLIAKSYVDELAQKRQRQTERERTGFVAPVWVGKLTEFFMVHLEN